jgi:hypothetical protein
MDRRAALFVIGLGALGIALAVVDYALVSRHETRREQAIIDLVDSYRFGTAQRPLSEEQAMLERHAERVRRRARVRLQVACAVGIVLLVVGAALIRRGERTGSD